MSPLELTACIALILFGLFVAWMIDRARDRRRYFRAKWLRRRR